MSTPRKIYIIHGKDADQHLGSLESILDELKNENRIAAYSTLKSAAVKENSFQNIEAGDMVILMLTHDLESEKAAIEQILINLKEKKPGSKFAEIIVDNIPYAPHFIAFPADLQPIRSREDMDNVWQSIQRTLRDFFPVRQEGRVLASSWKKFAPYALAVVVLAIIIYWLINPNDETKPTEVKVSQEILSEEEIDNEFPNASGIFLVKEVARWKSQGTSLFGTVEKGEIKISDNLFVNNQGVPIRVQSINEQVSGRAVKGEDVELNFLDVDLRSSISRGDKLVVR